MTLKATEVVAQPPVARVLAGNIGYVCIPNSLGENSTMAGFDAAMEKVRDTKGLVLDLRLTPSGGNTTVARAILSWFVEREREYQRHEDPLGGASLGIRRFWTEWVAPRAGKSYKKPVTVLVNHWTEAWARDRNCTQGMRRAKLIGSPMAGLKGATSGFTLSSSRIPYSFPTERLFRLDGTPRERCLPDYLVPFDGQRRRAAPCDGTTYHRKIIMTKILVFGTGVLLRGLIADCAEQAQMPITMVSSTPSGDDRARALTVSGGKFTLRERGLGSDGSVVDTAREVAIIESALTASDDTQAVLATASDPEIGLVISNVSESGV